MGKLRDQKESEEGEIKLKKESPLKPKGSIISSFWMFISPRLLSKPSNFSHSVISTISTSLFFPHIFSLICSLNSNPLHMAWITPLQKWSRNNFRALTSFQQSQLSEALFYDRPLVVAASDFPFLTPHSSPTHPIHPPK